MHGNTDYLYANDDVRTNENKSIRLFMNADRNGMNAARGIFHNLFYIRSIHIYNAPLTTHSYLSNIWILSPLPDTIDV